jgi:sulfide dehydrogenase cytochrome subunit
MRLAVKEASMMTKWMAVAVATACLVPAASFGTADPKLIESCNDCHGDKGVSSAQDVPTLAGVSEVVQRNALKAYQAKTRSCPKVSYKRGDMKRQGDMCAVAARLNETSVAELATYYAKQTYAAQKQTVDAAKAAAGKAVHDRYCKKCHSSGGRDPSDDAGILAGQPLAWLKTSLAAFRTGANPQPKKMKEAVGKLSDVDTEALAHYYASQP